MSTSARAVTAGTTALRLDSAQPGRRIGAAQGIAVRNNGATTVYLGGAGVTAAAGFPLAADESISTELAVDEQLWVVTASGTSEVRVLEVGL